MVVAVEPHSNQPFLHVLHFGMDTSNGTRIGAEVRVEDERLSVELGVSQDGSGHQLLLHGAEGSDSSCALLEMWNPFVLVLLRVLDKWRGDGSIVRDEAPVIPAFPQEGA